MSRNENGVTSDITNYQRSCHIVKRPDFEGYGFNLHSEKGKLGQYIGKVDENSPAEQAGLKQGDRIIEVNGVDIGKETHKQVVHRIKAISNEVRLLVIDPEKEKKINNNNSNKTSSSTTATTAVTPVTAPVAPTKPTTPTNDTIKTITSQPAKDDVDNNGIATTKELCNNNKDITINTDNGHKDVLNGITSTMATPTTISSTSLSSSSSTTITTSSSSTVIQKKSDNIIVPTAAIPPPQIPHIERPTTPSTSEHTGNSIPQQKTMTTTGLNLPMTAAEMRAKLLSKKKYDPKNDSVDVRKKFEIIKEL